MSDVTVSVIGGGIVGCAVADRLAGAGVETVLLEKEGGLARGTTSRNSEVAHGGMYYPTGTRKARYCVEGRRRLAAFCAEAGVGYRECGKLIVAVGDAEVAEVQGLLELGRANDVEDLSLLDPDGIRRLEPQIRAVAALYSPRTGILDAEGAARAYAARASGRGAQVMTDAPVTGLDREGDGWRVSVAAEAGGRREGWSHTSRVVVNAAGLFADRVARLAGVDVAARRWRLAYSKGNYFRIDPRHAGRVRRLVYPVPPADGSSLGVHVCVDLNGQLRLGPDFEPLAFDGRAAEASTVTGECWDYRVDEGRGDDFFRDAVRFLPWLERGDLGPDQCGIRPKLSLTGFADFVVSREEGDLAGLINLVGIDSPGLTSAPALAEEVAELVTEYLA